MQCTECGAEMLIEFYHREMEVWTCPSCGEVETRDMEVDDG